MAIRIILTVVGLLLVVAALASTKISQFSAMSAQAADMKPPAAVVATTPVKRDAWKPTFTASGTVLPVKGIILHSEATGVVKRIYFASGAEVKANDTLVQLDTATEAAQLQSAAASAELGRTTMERVQSLKGSAAVAQSEVESTDARSKQANAEVARLRSEISKRTMRAPFAGTLGIWGINIGQFVNVGDPVNTVMALDSVYVDFTMPQQRLSQLVTGLPVHITSDSFPGEAFDGTLTAIDPALDVNTRSIKLRATLDNPKARLRPGMFVHVEVVLPEARNVLVIPATAVIYAPYGDSVFVVEDKKGELTVQQSFVRLGEARGDFVEVVKGLDANKTIVSTGAFKLRNGMSVVVNNELKPNTSSAPQPEDN